MQMWLAGFVSVISLSLPDKPDIKSVMYADVYRRNYFSLTRRYNCTAAEKDVSTSPITNPTQILARILTNML